MSSICLSWMGWGFLVTLACVEGLLYVVCVCMRVCVCVCACVHVCMCACVLEQVYTLTRKATHAYTHDTPRHAHNTGWRRLLGSPKSQIIFHKRATKYKSLLRKMTYKDKGSYESSPSCISSRTLRLFFVYSTRAKKWYVLMRCFLKNDRSVFAC